MSRIFILRLALMLPTLGTVPLWAQRKDKRATVQAQTDTVKTTTQGIKQNVRSDAESLKSSIKTQTGAVTPDNTQGKAFKSSTQQQTKELLEDKTSNLEYNSEDPDNAPWKKQQLHVLDNPQAEFLKESAQMLKEGAISQCAVINRINFSEGI